jgi:hypothetical protein
MDDSSERGASRAKVPTNGSPGSPEDGVTPEPASSESSALFQRLLAEGDVSLMNLVEAAVLQSPILTEDAASRAIGEIYYPKLLSTFRQGDKQGEVVVHQGAGLGVALGSDDDAPLRIAIIRRTIRFDWTAPRRLLLEVNELEQDVRRWVPDAKERHSLLLSLCSIATQIQTTIARENERCKPSQDESTPASDQVAKDVALIEAQVAKTRERFLSDAQRSAQLRYAKGMGFGAAALGIICCLMGACFGLWHIQAISGVGLLAGGIGACVSVLQRMTSETLVLNIQTDSKMLEIFGAIRPFVGGVFGLVTFCVLEAGLISALVVPTKVGPELAFVAVFAFAAGFNERFFQDMLKGASKGFGQEETATDTRKLQKA